MSAIRQFLRRIGLDAHEVSTVAKVSLVFLLLIILLSLLFGVYAPSQAGPGFARDLLVNLHASAIEILLVGVIITWLLRRRWRPTSQFLIAELLRCCDECLKLTQFRVGESHVANFGSLSIGISFPINGAQDPLPFDWLWTKDNSYRAVGRASKSGESPEKEFQKITTELVSKLEATKHRLSNAIELYSSISSEALDHEESLALVQLVEALRNTLLELPKASLPTEEFGEILLDQSIRNLYQAGLDLGRKLVSRHSDSVMTTEEHSEMVMRAVRKAFCEENVVN